MSELLAMGAVVGIPKPFEDHSLRNASLERTRGFRDTLASGFA